MCTKLLACILGNLILLCISAATPCLTLSAFGSEEFPDGSDDIRLDLKIEGSKNRPILVITLANTGDKPVIVDRRLVFLVEICFITVQDESVPGQPGKDVPKRHWTEEEWKKRSSSGDTVHN